MNPFESSTKNQKKKIRFEKQKNWNLAAVVFQFVAAVQDQF